MTRLRVRRPRLRLPLALVVVLSLVGGLVASPAVTAQNTRSNGYWLAAASGNLHAFGDAPPLGGADRRGAQFVDLATTNTGRGYWLVTHDGRVAGVGDAAPYGSVSERSRRGGAIVAIAARPQADGYWVLQSDGDVHAFGAAAALAPLDRGAVYTDLAATPSGDGFWALDARGTVHARGDARSFGGASRPAQAIAIAPTPAGDGYWILSALGQVDALGAAVGRGDTRAGGPYVDMAVTRSGKGYWVADAQGRVYAFGDATHYGDLGRPLLRGAPVIAIAVTPFVNLPPIVTDDAATLNEDTHIVVDVLANDSDPENDPLRVRVRAAPLHGAAVVEADGRIRYTPIANYYGPDEIGYEADDGNGGVTPGVLRLTVLPVNDPPVAVDDALAVDEDEVLTVPAPGVLTNDGDIDGDPLVAAVSEAPEHGELALGADGSLHYTPAANYHGPDQFRYRATDPSGASSEATVRITVRSVPDAPIAAADAYEVDEDATLDRVAPGVVGNDTDADGDALGAVLVSGPANGTLTLRADGSFTYAPAANYNGPDRFTYRARDTGGLVSADVDVTIIVRPVNDPPAATDDVYSTAEDTSLTVAAPGVLLNDADIDVGDALRAALVSGPSNGTLVLDPDGGLTYTPAPNFNGPDAFTYRAIDAGGLSSAARVTITVAAVNDAPVARDDAYAVDEDATLDVAAPGVLGNDTDVERDALAARLVAGPAQGTIVLRPDGSFTYTPARDFHGEVSFRYEAFDGALPSAAATVRITVRPVNDAPVARDDAYTVAEDTPLTVAVPGVLGNDADVDGDMLSAARVSGPSSGTLALAGAGGFTYTPAPDFHGSDGFSYRAADPSGATSGATVTITVTPVNDAPRAGADAYVVDEDTVLDIAAPGVLANDSDVDSPALTARLVVGAANGTLALRPDGSFSFRPANDVNGPDSFRYEVWDGALASAPAIVSITVRPVNDAPVARPDTYSAAEDIALTVAAPGVLANDLDVDGDALTVELVTGPALGALTLAADGSFTYAPARDRSGTVTFRYRARDGSGATSEADVTIDVAARPDAPVATDDAYAVDEDTTLTVASPGVLANDVDVDGDALGAYLLSAPANGTLMLAGSGGFTYTPVANFHGSDVFSYQASDGALRSTTATVRITVRPRNDAPRATDDAYTTEEDAPLTVAAPGVLGNDVDVDGDALGASLLSAPANGTLVLAGSGGFTYTPVANFHGSDSFTYRAIDPSGAPSAPATVRLTVTPVNDAPSAVADAEAIDEDAVLDVAAPGVLENDTDVEGDALVARLVSGPSAGTLVLRPDGSYIYAPPPNFNGTATFRYEAFDGALASAAATVTITLTPVDDAPVANADAYSVVNTSTLTPAAPGVLGNDTDPDGNALTASLVSGPTSGTLTLAANGSFTYTPASGFAGSATFSYRASDGALSSSAATVTITVTASTGGGGGGGGGFGFGTPEEDFFDFEGGNVGPTTVNGVVKEALPFDWLE